MTTEYSSPEVQITLSNRLITKWVASLAPSLLPCPKDPDDGSPVYTNLVIDDVVTVRADDKTATDRSGQVAGGGENSALALIGKVFGFETIEIPYFALRGGAVGLAFKTPGVFVIVTGSVVRYSPQQDLRPKGNVEGALRIGFRRTVQAGEFTLPQLLFSVRAVRNEQLIRFNFEGVWDADAAEDSKDLIAPLKEQFAPVDIPYSFFDPLLEAFGLPTTILNVGITTEFWKAKDTPSDLGLRIGLDVHGPLSSDRWEPFYAAQQWLKDEVGLEISDLSVLVDGNIVVENLTERLAPLAAIPVPGGTLAPPRLSIEKGEITVRAFAHSGDLPFGNVVINLTPTAAQRNVPPSGILKSYLDIRICAHFDVDPGGALAIWFLATFAGTVIGGIGGPVGVLAGAIAGTVAGIELDLALMAKGGEAVDDALSGADPNTLGLDGLSCNAVDNQGCRTCSRDAGFSFLLVGEFLLSDSAWEKSGIGLAWTMQQPGLLKPAKLTVKPHPWEYELGICQAPSRDPVQLVTLRNEGELPLRICWAGQDTSIAGDVSVLRVAPKVNGSVSAPAIVLQPGEGTGFRAVAQITGDARYNQMRPPSLWFRALSSGGAIEIDLNVPASARSQDEEENQRQAEWGQLLCNLLKTKQLPIPRWRLLPFVDPIPFTTNDHVLERLDVHVRGVEEGETLVGLDVGERVLSKGFSKGGSVTLIMADERAPANSHGLPQLAVDRVNERGLSERPSPLRAAAVTLGRQLKHRSEDSVPIEQVSLQRSVYVRRGQVRLHSRIRHAIQANSLIIVATGDGLRIGEVSPGSLRSWRRVSVASPNAIAAYGQVLTFGNDLGLFFLDERMNPVEIQPGRVIALAALEQGLIQSDGRKLQFLSCEGTRFRVWRTIHMPDVVQLVSVGRSMFALAKRSIWRVEGEALVQTGIQADRLGVFQGEYISAFRSDRVTIFDEEGGIVMESYHNAWLANLLEWRYAAVEVIAEIGVLTVFERFSTMLSSTACHCVSELAMADGRLLPSRSGSS